MKNNHVITVQRFFIIILISLLSIFKTTEALTLDYATLLDSAKPLPLTTHPAQDYQSAVSAQGDFVVFVSTRSGQNDLWFKRLPGGATKRLTFHSSEDYEPDIDANGKRILFISKRDNAFGKTYLMSINGRPKQLTWGEGEEHSPKFTPDGKRIVFTRLRTDSEIADIYTLDLTKKTPPEKIIENGMNPNCSPDGYWLVYASLTETGALISLYNIREKTTFELSDGMTVDAFPVFSSNSQEIFFYRYSDDTNGDGQINMQDYPHLVKMDLRNLQESKLTTPEHFDYYPACGPDKIYFTRRQGDTTNILTIGFNGLVPRMPTAGEQYNLATSIQAPRLKRLALEQVEAFFPAADNETIKALMDLGQLEDKSDNDLQAWQAYQRIQNNNNASKSQAALAHIFQLRINLKIGATGETILLRLNALSKVYGDFPRVLAEIAILKADIHLNLGQLDQALSVYQDIPTSYPNETTQIAKAYFKMGRALSQLKFQDAAQENFLKVINDYSTISLWVDLALGELLANVKAEPNREKRLSSYRKIIASYPESTELFARITNVIADEYESSNDDELALSEYKKVLERLPPGHPVYFRAAFRTGEIYQNKQDYLNAIEIYNLLFDFPQPDKRKTARKKVADIYFLQGFEAINQNDYALAAGYFEQVLEVFPTQPFAFRQLVRCYAKKGKIDQFIKLLKNSLALNPDSAVLRYALGLSFSYKGEDAYPFAFKELDKAIKLNNRLLPAYLAVGWLFEQKLVNERKQSGSINEVYYQAFLDNYGLARAINDAKVNPALEADINLAMGNISYFKGSFQLASFYYQKRLELPMGKKDDRTEALFYRNLGRSLFMLNRFEACIDAYEQAAEIHVARLEWEKYVQILALEAFTQEKAGNNLLAINLYQKILATIKENGLTLPTYIIFANIGRNFYDMGEESEAVPYFQAALVELETIKETETTQEGLLRFSVQVSLEGNKSTAASGFTIEEEKKLIYSFLTKIHLAAGDYGEAFTSLNTKLKSLSFKASRDERAIILNNLGHVYYLTDQLAKAEEMFVPSLAEIRRHDPYGKLLSFLNLAHITVRQSFDEVYNNDSPSTENIDKAIKFGEKSLGVINELGSESDLGQADNILGKLHYLRAEANKKNAQRSSEVSQKINLTSSSLNDYYQAGRNWQRALDKVEKRGDIAAKNRIRFNLTKLEYALGEVDSSLVMLEELLSAAEANGDLELQWHLLKFKGESLVPEKSEQLLNKAANLIEKGYFLSRYEGMALNPEVTELYQELIDFNLAAKNYPQALNYSERLRQLRLVWQVRRKKLSLKSELDNIIARNIEYYHQQITDNLYQNAAQSEKKRKQLWQEYNSLKETTSKDNPDLASLYWIVPFETEKLQALLPAHSAVLNYQITSQSLNIWLIDRKSIRYAKALIPSEKLKELQRLYLTSLKARKNHQKTGQQLADYLLGPFADELKGYTRLFIVNDEELSQLPFTCLPFEEGYLIDSFELANSYSLYDWLISFRKRNLSYTSHFISGLTDDLSESALLSQQRFLKTSSQIFLNQKRHLRLDGKELLEKVSSYGIVSWFNSRKYNPLNPWESGLKTKDGILSVSEFFQTPYNSALMVFVKEAGGPTSRWMERRLFTRALHYGGCPQMLFANWETDLSSQLKFLEELYARLNSQPEAQAVREVVLGLKEKHPQPFNWAGFKLFGYGGNSTTQRQTLKEELYLSTRQQALNAFAKEKWEISLNLFELAARMGEGLSIVTDDELEKIYVAVIVAATQSGAYAKASQYQEKFVGKALRNNQSEEIYRALSKQLYLQGEAGLYEEAISSGESLISYLESQSSHEEQAVVYNNLGRLLRLKKDFYAASEYFEKSMMICRKLELTERLAQNYFDRANMKTTNLDDYQGALVDYDESLRLYEELNQPARIIQIILARGRVWLKSGRYIKALTEAQKAAEIAKQQNDESLLAEAIIDLASANWYLGDHVKAQELSAKALKLSIQLENKKLELMTRTLRGLILLDEAEYKKALYEQEIAVELAITIKDDRDLASAYNNLGLTRRKSGQLNAALTSFEKALGLDIKLNSKWGQMYAYRNLGITALQAKTHTAAVNYLEHALRLALQLNNSRQIILNNLYLGISYQGTNSEKALKYFNEAASLAEKFSYLELLWRALYNSGVAEESRANINEAFSFYQKAIAVLVQQPPMPVTAAQRYEFNESPALLYANAIAISWRLGEHELAFQYGEQAKGLAFFNLVANQDIIFEDNRTAQTFEEYLALWKKERSLSRKIAETSELSLKNELTAQLSTIVNEKRQVFASWQKKAPNLYSLVNIANVDIPLIQENLASGEALIAYYINPEELYIWLLSKESLQMYQVPINKNELLSMIATYRTKLQKTASYERLSKELFQILISPLQPQLSSKKLLFIVPHQNLHYLPFSSLFDGKQFLVEQFLLAQLPQANLLPYCRSIKLQKLDKVLALGNPTLNLPDKEIPFSEKEVKSITRSYPSTLGLVKSQATESAFKSLAKNYQALHFGSHGELAPLNPLFSSLELAADEQNDGHLRVREILGMDLPGQIVTLSACQTGLGAKFEGEEISGLNRAFLFAGIPSVVATLWRINDVTAAILTKRFYRYLVNDNKAVALQKAQLLVKKYYPHPVYWAAFTLTGIP